ncbi:hypothetical protein BO78DRAFT_320471 [Aspergillus sclerotiicarbonarius CBS 121057]|uniref:Uncharacterized protein n=1 Tax=Aspergillus sclerotiicarbonarius (strain CBS 121057 / IBT 28362) TaxID=1448318 RepID=A0A319ETF7_ASPSB|nr:hypothetical protein BO78DRAFT_320471 [Aspergillus sclerotiicarbonarius CBS 121057]
MWPKSISAQSGFALASLLLTTGVSAAAVPSGPVSVSVTPSFVADVAENTHISTTGADGEATPVPVVGGPDCWDENNQTTGGWALLGINSAGTYLPSAVSEFSETIPVITVSSNGDPTYSPSKTTGDTATEVKRASTPTVSDTKYHILEEALGKKTPKVGEGYALKLKVVRDTVLGVDIPDHYLLVTGYVKQELGETGSIELTFDGYCFDIGRRGTNGDEIYFNDRCGTTSATSWYSRENAKYEILGEIKSGLTATRINNLGKEVAKEMNKKKYNTLTNNCRDFVLKLYKEIKA